MIISRVQILVAALAFGATFAQAAVERRPEATTLRALVALGCSNVPEEGPRAMNCGSDAGYFLCAVFEKLGKPIECQGAATPAIPDIDKLSDDRFLHVDVPRIATTVPCAIWAYPEDDPIKHAASRRCALQVLRILHCKTSPANDTDALAHTDGKLSANCEKPQQRTCASLLEAGLVDRCTP